MSPRRPSARWIGIACAACALGFAPGSGAAEFVGQIKDPDARPIDGAMISIVGPGGVAESVYSDTAGNFRLVTQLEGDVDLRVRKRYYHDERGKVRLANATPARADAVLRPLTDPQEISDDHPSISHFARIAFDTDEKAPFSRGNFARDCLSCHSLGNRFTRSSRPAESWVPTVQRMHGYLGNADDTAIHKRAELLAAAFDGTRVSSRPLVPVDPLLFRAKVYQWPLPGTVVPHDAVYSPRSGRIYVSEMFAGEVLEANLQTGEVLHFPLPADGMPPGGAFTKMGSPAPYGLTTPRAPHSLAEGGDGRWYLTDSIGASITVFDPATRAFENFDVGGGAIYPHTVRIAGDGVVWFTIAFSNQVGRFDPKTHEMKVITLPVTPSFSTFAASIPYGLDVHPVDGGVWYTKLASDKIGHIDPKTLTVTEYDSPVRGPRRQRFDAAGHLWVTGFSDGTIAKIDVASFKAEIYPLPVYAPGEIPAPYALAVHPRTQEIWINDTMLDMAWRFLPAEKRFIAYPMPLKGTYTRDFTFTREGWACTSNNPIPPASLEGGVPELICIDPGDAATL